MLLVICASIAVFLVLYTVMPTFGIHLCGDPAQDEDNSTVSAFAIAPTTYHEKNKTGENDTFVEEMTVTEVEEDDERPKEKNAEASTQGEAELSAVFGGGGADTTSVGDSSEIVATSQATVTAHAAKLKEGLQTRGSVISGLGNAIPAGFDSNMYQEFVGLLKILLGFMQVVSTLTVNLPTVPWPSVLTSIWDAVGVVANIDIFEGLNMDCLLSGFNFYSNFVVTVLYPLVFQLAIALVTWYRVDQTSDVDERKIKMTQGWKISLFLLFLIYPSVSATVLQMWHCRDIDGTEYLTADYRITCWEGDHLTYAMIAAIAFVVYPLGIPVFFLYELIANRDALYDEEHQDHADVTAKISFLFRAYKEDAFYWEVVILVQKLLLTGLLIFIKPNTVSQLAAGFTISIVFWVLHVRTMAYVNETESDLQFYSQLSITMTLFGGILLKTNTQDEDPAGLALMSFLLLVINIGVVILFIVQCYKSVSNSRKVQPSLLSKAQSMAMEIVVAKCKEQAAAAITLLGYEEDDAHLLRDQCIDMFNKIAAACNALEDCRDIIDDLEEVACGKLMPAKTVDKFIGVSVKVMGKEETITVFDNFTSCLLNGVSGTMAAAGADVEVTDKLKAFSRPIAGFIVKYGVEDFFSKWYEGVIGQLKSLDNLVKAGQITQHGIASIVDEITRLYAKPDE